MNSHMALPSGEQSIIHFRDSNGPTPGQAYSRFRNTVYDTLKSRDPRHVELVGRANADMLRLKDVSPGSVQDNRFLSNLSVQYKNDDYIGLMLMPDVPASNQAGEYPIYDKRSRLAVPDDAMSNRTTANEISDARTLGSFFCKPYALSNFVGVLTLRNQVAPLDEMVDLTEATTEAISLKREIRIAAKVTNAANYATGNKVTIAAGSRWDDAGGGDPIAVIQAAVAALWTGRGPGKLIGYCSLPVWNVLARHPAILDLFKYGGGSPGLATPDMIAKFFGLDGMLVSKARNDTANEGQTASYARIWGNFFGVMRVADRASIRNAGFGMTMRFGNVDTRVWFDPKCGVLGGYYAQVSAIEDYNIQAADAGYLVSTPLTTFAG